MNPKFGAFVRLLRREPALIAVSLMAGLLMAGLSGCGANPASSSSLNSGSNSTPKPSRGDQATTNPTPRVPAHYSNADDAKPFPAVLDPKQFSNPSVVKAYAFARDLPDIFSQQPCLCYCDSGNGHRSLLDCFATDHGAGCQLCLQEAILINKLHKEGKNASEIRNLILQNEWKKIKLE
ncbi:MAG TPA: CYCXC family (seleno)protein [Blastocatellia bacterium]|nr:CYCXC family (seleno)protein [Blastocatellia bacterium]